MTRRKTPPPPPTREEQRAADNVRPLGEVDPTLCPMQQDRPAFDRNSNCWACAYRQTGATTHCHLYETCDRCRDDANPCDTARQLKQFAKRFATPPRTANGHDA